MAQCEVCGTEVVQGRGRARRTCSAACRQKAHRQRQAEQLAELRTTAGPALAAIPPVSIAAPVVIDDSPAGQIRAAGIELTEAIENAARQAAENWSHGTTDAMVTAVRVGAAEVIASILASAPAVSRDEPSVAAPAPATPEGSKSSRNEPAAKAPARRKRLTQRAARAIADSAQLVKHPEHRDNHRWNLVAEDGTVLGHVEPSYGGVSQSGRNGWKYQVAHTFVSGGPHKTRDAAAVQCALSWTRLITAPQRNTLTGD